MSPLADLLLSAHTHPSGTAQWDQFGPADWAGTTQPPLLLLPSYPCHSPGSNMYFISHSPYAQATENL